MNFPLILSISSLAVGGITYATIQSQQPFQDAADDTAIVRPLAPEAKADPAVSPMARHAEASVESTAMTRDWETVRLEARIAELEAENARLKAHSPGMRPMDSEKIGQLFEVLSQAPQIQNVAAFGQDPAKILGLSTPEQRRLFDEILARFGKRYQEVVKLNTREDVEASNESMTVSVVEPFPEEGTRLRDDLRYELSNLNGDPDKVDAALDALAPRYNNWGQSESRMMTMSGNAFGLGEAEGSKAQVQMMFQSEAPVPMIPGDDGK